MELCLITSNIRFDNPSDGANSWPNRREFLTETLLSHNPDIIATQEGRFDQLQDMGSLLPGFHLVDEHRSWIKPRMYPTIYVRKDKFEICQSGDIWLSETPEVAGSLSFDSAFPRLMTWVRVQVKNTENNLLVVNTHLDHVREETRIEQIKVLTSELKKIWTPNQLLMILGDFNDSPESKVRQTLENEFPGIQDSWKIFNTEEESSHHSFKGFMENGARIDWVLADERSKVVQCLMDKAVKDMRYPSDHFPVVCKLRV